MQTTATEAPAIPAHGILHGLSNEAYHAHSAIGSSAFKLLERSPMHFWAAYIDPNRERRESTKAQRIGSAWHCATFEPGELGARYAVRPDISAQSKLGQVLDAVMAEPSAWGSKFVAIPDGLDGRTKEGKAINAELALKDQVGVQQSDFDMLGGLLPGLLGRELMPQDQLDAVQKMAAAARAHPVGRVILEELPGVAEASIFIVDPRTGLRLKIRPDYSVPPGVSPMFPHGLIVDGKSMEDASDEGLAKFVWNWASYYQAAFYSDVWQAFYGTAEPPPFVWLAQEKEPPFATNVRSCPPALMAYGRAKYRRLLDVAAECERTGIYPGYPAAVQPLSLPVWMEKAAQEALGLPA